MHVLFITADSKFLENKGERRALLEMMTEAADVLHVVVFSGRGHAVQKISDRAWVYPTNSLLPLLYFLDALRTIRRQLLWQGQLRAHIVVSDDPFLTGWLGTMIARRYERVWMINIHNFFWEKYAHSLTKRLFAIPLSYIFKYAYRILVFSERVNIYIRAAAHSSVELDKVVAFPAVYDDTDIKNLPAVVDIKEKYPEFKFVILTAASGTRLQLALETLMRLRQSYRKAGLVVIGKPKGLARFTTMFGNISDVVKFEPMHADVLSYFKTTNVFLYLASGEEEDEMLIRAAAASCPIVALDSVISRGIIKDGVNGFIVEHSTVEELVTTIHKFNETAGIREQFRINSSVYLHELFVENRALLVNKLKEYWSFEETPEIIESKVPEEKLLSTITQKPSRVSTIRAFIQSKINYFIGK